MNPMKRTAIQWKQSFQYDRYGNRSINAANTTTSMVGLNPAISAVKNRVSQSGYSYDSAGNMTVGESSHTYSFDAENRMVSFDAGTDHAATYTYDGEGHRVKKVVGTGSLALTTTFIYDSAGKLIAEYATNTAGSQSGTSYLTQDHLGSTRVVMDAAKIAQARYDYLPFGEEIASSFGSRNLIVGYETSDAIRQKFTGYERDNETGLDYAQARYYGSMAGRFTSPDSYNIILEAQATAEINPDKAQAQFTSYLSQPQRWNRYCYVANNPLKYVDPSGEDLELTGSERERAMAFERIKLLVGPKAAQYLYITETQDKDGNYHYFVQIDTSRLSDPLASLGGELGTFISDIINTTNIVEYRIAKEFSTKNTRNIQTAGDDCGGGCTVGREESLTGNTQIFVHPDAGNVTQFAFNTPLNQANKVRPRGQLDFYNDIVDAHEFGHAHANAIEGISLGKGQTGSHPRSLQLENYVRERRGLSKRRTGH